MLLCELCSRVAQPGICKPYMVPFLETGTWIVVLLVYCLLSRSAIQHSNLEFKLFQNQSANARDCNKQSRNVLALT